MGWNIKGLCAMGIGIDFFIAATAKAFNLPLVTADKGFKKIEDIEVILLDLTNDWIIQITPERMNKVIDAIIYILKQ